MSSNSSKSSKGVLGNTKPKPKKKKQISPAKRWCFTLNNYTEQEISSIVPLLKEQSSLGIIAKEVGDKGTPHLQGYIEFKKKIRPLSLGITRIHWEKCKGTRAQNKEYCEKDGNILAEWGFPREIEVLQEDMLYEWQKRILKIVIKPPPFGDRVLRWYYGSYGLGKSVFLKYLCFKHGAVCLEGERRHILSVAARNRTCEIFVINLPKGQRKIDYQAVEMLKDGLFCDTFGTKAQGMVIMNTPHVIVMGNEPPYQGDEGFHEGKWIVECLG